MCSTKSWPFISGVCHTRDTFTIHRHRHLGSIINWDILILSITNTNIELKSSVECTYMHEDIVEKYIHIWLGAIQSRLESGTSSQVVAISESSVLMQNISSVCLYVGMSDKQKSFYLNHTRATQVVVSPSSLSIAHFVCNTSGEYRHTRTTYASHACLLFSSFEHGIFFHKTLAWHTSYHYLNEYIFPKVSRRKCQKYIIKVDEGK